MSRLRKEIKALTLEKKKTRDYDPEDIEQDIRDNASNSDSEQEVPSAGREHYEQVGKSKLRKPEGPLLGSKYGGVVVSRNALEASDEESDFDALAIQSEDDDEDIFAIPGLKGTQESDESNEEQSGSDDNGSMATDDVSEGDEDELESGEEDSREPASEGDEEDNEPKSSLRQQAEAFAAASSSNIAADLSQAATQEVKKGQAIRKQNQALDRILDARMKLQKGVVASDQLTQSPFTVESGAEEALLSAKTAAIQLFNTMTEFRERLTKANTEPTKKRKRDVGPRTSPHDQWAILQGLENDAASNRRQIIDKWSNKTKQGENAAASASSRSKLLDSSTQNRQLTAVLDVFITNEQEKQLGQSADAVLPTYDDNTFYQSLLRDLITSRSASSTTATNISASVLPPKLHPSGNRQNKKTVDTKASKGRKIRYTVHEKLQNFMAAEGDTGRDTSMWTERGKREFFGSLFGQDRALNEDDDAKMEEDGLVDHEQVALRLFKT